MQSENQNNRINKVVETAIKNLGNMVDVSSVVGKPIKTEDGEYVFPIANVTLGILSGGGEYGKTNIFKKSEDLPFSAGNGAIISLKPSGFLIKDENSKYKVVSVNTDSYEKVFDVASDFLNNLNKGL